MGPANETLEKIARLKRERPNNIAIQCFDAEFYTSLNEEKQSRLLKCMISGIENPESEVGCYANTSSDYDDLHAFFAKVLARYHNVPEVSQHSNNWELSGIDGPLDIAKLGFSDVSIRVRVGRNLVGYPLPAAMTKKDRVSLEMRMMAVFDHLIDDPAYGGAYHSLTPGNPNQISEADYQQLVADHLMFKSMSDDPYLRAAGIASDWPYGRGCYVSKDCSCIIWVGEEDHLRIISMASGTILNTVFDRLKAVLDLVETMEGVSFAKSDTYGYITSCPTNLGTGMRAGVHIQFPNLTADGTDNKLKEIAKPLGLMIRGLGGEHTPIGVDGMVDISPSARFCVTEAEIITALYNGIALLKAEEDRAA